jgi:hypothetical protein
VDRELTALERQVLEAMLTVSFKGADELRGQICQARVTYECPCGCPTIGLTVRASGATPAPVPNGDVLQASVTHRADGLVLFVQNGFLGTLEYWTTADAPPTEFPEAHLISPRLTRAL